MRNRPSGTLSTSQDSIITSDQKGRRAGKRSAFPCPTPKNIVVLKNNFVLVAAGFSLRPEKPPEREKSFEKPYKCDKFT
jgi:hypothetical protein